MNTGAGYFLQWDFRREAEPVASDLVFFGILGCALVVLIARAIVTRRRRRQQSEPTTFRRATLVLAVLLVVGAIVFALGWEGTARPRAHQQAALIERQLGVRVVDSRPLPGLEVVHDVAVQLKVPDVIAATARVVTCQVSTTFYDKHGDLISHKPGRGEGNGHMLLTVKCPQPIDTPVADHNRGD